VLIHNTSKSFDKQAPGSARAVLHVPRRKS
jgi:hypothetical protein